MGTIYAFGKLSQAAGCHPVTLRKRGAKIGRISGVCDPRSLVGREVPMDSPPTLAPRRRLPERTTRTVVTESRANECSTYIHGLVARRLVVVKMESR